jgi:ribulose-5-phosphate 4-epimerase/fuculose-1-phosphate aldolase
MDDSIFTHISARTPDAEDRFLMIPYGLMFEEVRASDLATVDLDGRVLDDPTELGINPAGFIIHSAVHAARPEVRCVLHLHTVAGVAVACQRDGLLPLNQWALQFDGRIAYHDYEAIALDLEERERLVADLGDKPVMFLRNHGTLVAGRSVAEAWCLAFNLERACKAQLWVQASGAPVTEIPSETRATTTRQYQDAYDARYGAVPAAAANDDDQPDIEWAAFLRLLDRKSPGYAD